MCRHWYFSLVLVLLASLVTSSCLGGDDDDEETESGTPVSTSASAAPSPTPTPITAESVLESASAQWAETESAHFTLGVEGNAWLDDDETIRLVSAEGDIARPNSVEGSATINVAIIGEVDISIIAIGEDSYITNFVSGNWKTAPPDFSYNPAILFDDEDGIGPILTELESPELDGEETIDGRETRRVTGTVTAEAVDEITAGSIQGEDIDVILWIDAETDEIVQVQLTEPEGVREDPATWTLQMSDHNAPVEIEPPIASPTTGP